MTYLISIMTISLGGSPGPLKLLTILKCSHFKDPIHVSAWSNIKLYTTAPLKNKRKRNASCKKKIKSKRQLKEKGKKLVSKRKTTCNRTTERDPTNQTKREQRSQTGTHATAV